MVIDTYSAKDAYRDAKENLCIVRAKKYTQIKKELYKSVKAAVRRGSFFCYSVCYSKDSVAYQVLDDVVKWFKELGYKVVVSEFDTSGGRVPIVQLTISWDLSEEDNTTET